MKLTRKVLIEKQSVYWQKRTPWEIPDTNWYDSYVEIDNIRSVDNKTDIDSKISDYVIGKIFAPLLKANDYSIGRIQYYQDQLYRKVKIKISDKETYSIRLYGCLPQNIGNWDNLKYLIIVLWEQYNVYLKINLKQPVLSNTNE